MKKIGIPRALLYYYDETLWLEFFKNLHIQTVISDKSNKKILSDGEKIANSEACLSLKMYLGHIKNLENKCDYVLVPRLFSIKKHEHVCTNFNALYDIVNNLFSIEILNYNVDLTTRDYKLMGFLKMGEELGFSYIKSYQAYKLALKKAKEEVGFNTDGCKLLIETFSSSDDIFTSSINSFAKYFAFIIASFSKYALTKKYTNPNKYQ